MTGRAERSPDGTPRIWLIPQQTRVEELRLQNKHKYTNAHNQPSGTSQAKDIEQQTGNMSDAVAVFSHLRVSLCRIEAFQQPEQDRKQHFHKAQHTIRHALLSQSLLDREENRNVGKENQRHEEKVLMIQTPCFPESIVNLRHAWLN